MIKHKITIGSEEFIIEVASTQEGDDIFLDVDSSIEAQRKLALKLVIERKEVKEISPHLFSFLLDQTGMRGADICRYLNIDSSNLTQWRRDKKMSSAAWTMFRMHR